MARPPFADLAVLQPILTKVANKEELNIDLVTVDTEALEAVAQKYQVRSAPPRASAGPARFDSSAQHH